MLLQNWSVDNELNEKYGLEGFIKRNEKVHYFLYLNMRELTEAASSAVTMKNMKQV